MQKNALLHNNIELWSRSQPKDALLLPYRLPRNIEMTLTRSGEKTLLCKEKQIITYLHCHKGAVAEAQRVCSSVSLEGKQLLYVYGVGLGYFYDQLSSWLREDKRRRLVFLESDLDVLFFFMQTKRATTLLRDPQVDLYYFSDLKSGQAVFDAIYWDNVLAQMEFIALPAYAKKHNQLYEELRHKLIYDSAVKNALVEEYLRYGANFFKNYYANMLHLGSSYLGNGLFGKFKGVPAILCGAGPSLSDVIPILKKVGDRALIFGGGSAMNALCNSQLLPHFGCGIDPNPMQLNRLKSSSAFEVPFFYRNRVLHQAFRMMHGPRLYVTGSGGYDVALWYEKELSIESDNFDEGHNVVNFCLQIASKMGCDPIIFVGMDLGFSGMRSYAAGVEKNVKVRKKDLFGSGDFDKDALLRKDIHGKPLYTLWKWIAESDWIGEFAKDNPDLTLINATGAGLGFPHVPNLPLEQALAKHCSKDLELHSYVHSQIQQCSMANVTDKKMHELTAIFQESLTRCVNHLTVLLEDNLQLIKKLRKEKEIPQIIQSGLAALAETELIEEVGYTYLLDLFNNIYSRILDSHLRKLRISKRSKLQQLIAKGKINTRKLIFLRDVAKISIGIIAVAFEAYKVGDMPDEEQATKVFKKALAKLTKRM